MRSSEAVSIRSTSTCVSDFQKARVVLGSTRALGSPSKETMATSLGPACTISKFCSATGRWVRCRSSARSGAISARTALTTSTLEMAPGVERGEPAGLQKAYEAAVTSEESPLVVLDDNLEPETVLAHLLVSDVRAGREGRRPHPTPWTRARA